MDVLDLTNAIEFCKAFGKLFSAFLNAAPANSQDMPDAERIAFCEDCIAEIGNMRNHLKLMGELFPPQVGYDTGQWLILVSRQLTSIEIEFWRFKSKPTTDKESEVDRERFTELVRWQMEIGTWLATHISVEGPAVISIAHAKRAAEQEQSKTWDTNVAAAARQFKKWIVANGIVKDSRGQFPKGTFPRFLKEHRQEFPRVDDHGLRAAYGRLEAAEAEKI